MATQETLGRRALNRALLGRQLLLGREALPVPRAVARLVGLQAQEPPDPYVALWSRIEGFGHEDLADLLVQRRVVRMTLVRGTIHLVTAPDGLSMWPVMRPLFERTFRGSEWGRNLDGLDLDEVLAVGRELVSDEPRTAAQLAPPLTERWPDRDKAALVAAVRYLLPMVQVPPRGVWGQRGMPTLTTADRWIGRPLGRTTRPDRMMMRYLQAFGPASVADMRTWSGLSGLREVAERLRPRLRTYRDEDGHELLDGPDGLFPDPDTVAPPRFLPTFDNVTLSHDDRRRIVDDDDRRRLLEIIRGGIGTFLIDGFVAGTWKVERKRGRATLEISPLDKLSRGDADALAEEGERLLGFMAGDAQGDIRIVRAGTPT